jgi:hypothetical protein
LDVDEGLRFVRPGLSLKEPEVHSKN